MKTKIQKWGNSLAVRLPKSIIQQKALKEGSGVSVGIKNNQIIIQPLEEELKLDTLLAAVSSDNLHQEADWGQAQGKEVW